MGLNVPYPVVKYVSSFGMESLPGNVKGLLPAVDTSNAKHRMQFFELVGVHADAFDPDALDRMYQAQCLWDEYMAESVSRQVAQARDSLFVVIAGVGHVIGRVGIPDRIAQRCRESPFVIVPQEVAWSRESGLPDVEKPLSLAECDWAWYTQRELL